MPWRRSSRPGLPHVTSAPPVPLHSSVLSNGITIVTRQRPGSQVLAIDAAVRAGARYEDERTASAARFLESALMLGTSAGPPGMRLIRAVAGRGGELSVAAGREVVEVTVTVGQPDADLAWDVLGEVMLRSRFDPRRSGARARGASSSRSRSAKTSPTITPRTSSTRPSSPGTRWRTCRTAPLRASRR